MRHRCPKCHRRIVRITEGCPHCHWTFAESVAPAGIDQHPEIENAVEVDEAIEIDHDEPSPSDQYFELAQAEIGEKSFESALNSLNHALIDAETTDLGKCYSLRGYVNLKLMNFQAAIDDCSESLRLRGEHAETLAWRAAAYGELGEWHLAFRDLIAACNISTDPTPYEKLLKSYSEPALEAFRQKVKAGEADDRLFCDRGQIYLTIGDVEKARRDFLLALDENDRAVRALIGLADMELTDENYAEADRLASQALIHASEFRNEALRIRALANARKGETSRKTSGNRRKEF